MLLMGDEMGRTQRGNNNPYCQDNAVSWVDWQALRREDEQLRELVRSLVALRRRHRVFSRARFFRGEAASAAGLKDITWIVPRGGEATHADWHDRGLRCLGYVLGGAAGEFYTAAGRRDIDESFLVMMNADHADVAFRFPELPVPMAWELLVDTAQPDNAGGGRLFRAGEAFPLAGRSLALFVNRAPEETTARPLSPGPAHETPS